MEKMSDQQLQKEAKRLSKQILSAAESSHNETELRLKIDPYLMEFMKKLEMQVDTQCECPIITGRTDALYNCLLIEYKSPGTLQSDNAHKPNQNAIDQAKGYIFGLVKKQKKPVDRFAAVIMDGCYFIFLRFRQRQWRIEQPTKVTAASTEHFLRLLLNLSSERALIPDNLIADFGGDSPISREAVSALYNVLTQSDSPRVYMIYRQWREQFSEVCDYNKASGLKVPELADKYGIETREKDPFILFFSIHTYYAIFIKLLALQIIRFYTTPMLGTDLMQVAAYGMDELKTYLQRMEGGAIYKELGIANFLEADLFRWYLDAWDESLYSSMKNIIGRLASYSLQSLQQEQEEAGDLLKKLYHQLMPRKIRHNLGQYFTPDWLAERLLNMLELGRFQGDPETRLLDPSCGSGTFLVIAIEKIRAYAKREMLPKADVLEKILQNIVGFDLDPLAVISARTNYLLALGDLIKYRKGDINIPVYLCDSILTPSEQQDLFQIGKVQFTTSVGKFAVPRSLVSASYIDELANLLEEAVKLKLNEKQLTESITQRFPLLLDKDACDIEIIQELYQKLMDLQKQGINGIWARIIKNAFAPLFHKDFDYIAGNPPWINWEHLPENYRKNTARIWLYYRLFEQKGMRAAFTKDDISIIMTYAAMDNYLKNKGKLGFVITQSLFKTELGGKAFRKFRIKNKIPVKVLHIDDMVTLTPFEGAKNRTSIIILQKNRTTTYPITSYLLWKKIKKGSIPIDSSLEDVVQMTKRYRWVAEPVNLRDKTSSWLTGKPQALKAVRKVIGASDYTAHEGVNTGGANAVYWVEIVDKRPDGLVIVRNITKGAKRKIEQVEAAIEPDLLYPLLRGRDINRWKAQPSVYILLTHLPGMRLNTISENDMKTKYPEAYIYFKRFENILLKRRGWEVKQSIMAGRPFWSMSEIGDYTFAPFKVAWTRIATDIKASFISSQPLISDKKIIIPIETATMVAFDDSKEAYYFSSLINSSPARFTIISYSVEGTGSFAAPHILTRVRIPKFDFENKLHMQLAVLAEQAHSAAKEDNWTEVAEVEKGIDMLAAQLWALTDREIDEINISLQELQGK